MAVIDGKVVTDHYEVLTENRNWYNNIDITSNSRGELAVAYTWGKYNAIVKTRNAAKEWSQPVVITYDDGHCAIRPHIALDEAGTLHYVWQFGNRNGHMHRNACIVYNEVALSEMSAFADNEIEKKIDQFVQPIPGEKALDSRRPEEVSAWLKKNGYGDLRLVFGDIHGQSNLSDALGEIDQYYHYAKKDARMDFCALTDHDNYPDIATDAEWSGTGQPAICSTANRNSLYCWHMNGLPTSTNMNFGHKNVYYPSSTGGLYRSTDRMETIRWRCLPASKRTAGSAFRIIRQPTGDWYPRRQTGITMIRRYSG